MRKLVYVGINKAEDEMVETTSYEKMVEYRNKGFVFHDRMEEVKKEETEEQRAKRLATIAKRNAKLTKIAAALA